MHLFSGDFLPPQRQSSAAPSRHAAADRDGTIHAATRHMRYENAARLSTPATALLLAGATVAALFFNGQHVVWYAAAMALLTTALALQGGNAAQRIVWRDPLLVTLLLFQGWLLLTLLWNPAPYLGIGYFWLLAIPLLMVLGWQWTGVPDTLWRWLWPPLLLIGAALAGYALYQYHGLGEQPRATFINRNSLAALLNLLLLVAASRLLILAPQRRTGAFLLLALIALLALVVGLIGSRGAYLGLAGGLLLMTAWVWQSGGGWRRSGLVIVAVAVGLILSNVTYEAQVTQRIATLSDPYSAGNDRFLIWNQTVAMGLERPVTGHGIGTYWQHWPQWRHPDDRSGGFWAHNDLLHLWVEAGAPAVLLLLAVHFALLWRFLRLLRSSGVARERKLEAAALFGGLVAVAIHAQFTFAYYNLPIVLVLALVMGYLARLAPTSMAAEVTVAPPRRRWLVPLLTLPLLLYFASVGTATWLYERATAQMQAGELIKAETGFVRAQRLWGSTDIFYHTHAWLKLQQFQATPAEQTAERQRLFEEGMALLDRAVANNPLRPIPHAIRGRLLVAAADLAGDDWLPQAEAAFAESIRLDPRYLEGRTTLARILNATGRHDEALALLEDGIHHWYPDDPASLAYYRLLAEARARAGDFAGTSEMVERANRAQQRIERRRQ